MTRSVPLRHLTVHPPAPEAGPTAVRGQAGKAVPRPSFADLLRTQQRSVTNRPSTGAARSDATQAEPLSLLADPHDGADEALAASPPVQARAATEDDSGADDGQPDGLHSLTSPASHQSDGAPEIDALEASPHSLALVAYLASTVTEFCNNPDVHTGDGWNVRMTLNENFLPSTTLHLSLSLHWLLLRFECGDARAKAVIAVHRGALQSALEDAVSPRREVSIDCD